jgi:hypothetical protein
MIITGCPDVFKSVQATNTGDTALWTPATGKKFRLMKLIVMVPPNCTLAARGVLTIKLRDGTTDMNITHDVFLGQTAPVETASSIPTDLLQSGLIDLGPGLISAAVNNVLNVNLSSALAAGNVRVTAMGTEESTAQGG